MLAVAGAFQELRAENARLRSQAAHQFADNAATVAALESRIYQLEQRWLGTPALWQAPKPPARTVMEFFKVTGSTPSEIARSIEDANICGGAYGKCLEDPGAPPGGGAAALEWNTFPRTPCYSPRTATLVVTYHILLPRWQPPTDGSVTIQTVIAWNAVVQVLYTHEAKHQAIAAADYAAMNTLAHQQGSCAAAFAVWDRGRAKLNADQLAYHAMLRKDCRPELGCLPYGWMGWYW
jgi:hypothetical protein